MWILSEFIQTYISDIDIYFEIPTLDENIPISRPALWLDLMPGVNKETGMGRVFGSDKKAILKQVSIMAYWIITPELGGTGKSLELSGKLEQVIPKYSDELAQAELHHAKISPAASIPKGDSIYYGSRHLITYSVPMQI
ncbi:MAG: hypothetical protein Q8910_00450 [Bacteroidota bacterium]|nr:hypothetical protein [Bacteroidota bacterium]